VPWRAGDLTADLAELVGYRRRLTVGSHDGEESRWLLARFERGINAGDERRLGADQAAEFVRDRGEHRRGRHAAGYQCGHSPQRGLLVGERRELADEERRRGSGDDEGDQ
jgi:hypothetical protein